MKPVTHWDLAQSAMELTVHPKLTSADKSEAIRLAQLRSFTRKDKESLSALKFKYRT